jgi:hypothetical protein
VADVPSRLSLTPPQETLKKAVILRGRDAAMPFPRKCLSLPRIFIGLVYRQFADHSGRAVYGINYLPPSNTVVVVSNLNRGMDVCLHSFCVCVVLCR